MTPSTIARRSRSRRRASRSRCRCGRRFSAAPLRDRAHTTPLVGRERELAQLREALARARDDRAPQLVTLVGEPGVRQEPARIRGFREKRRRCLAEGSVPSLGDGVAFWALGEIVKAQLGIFESDSTEKAEEKLLTAVGDPWLEATCAL